MHDDQDEDGGGRGDRNRIDQGRGDQGREGSRRRGAALEVSILEAAWAELQEVGYARVTMEGVAARARTGKQVLYRRWPNRAMLVTAAMRHVLGPLHAEPPATGNLRDDVLAVLRRMAERVRSLDRGTMSGLLAELQDIDPLPFAGSPSVMQAVLEAAVGRGELVRADLSRHVVDLPLVLFRYEGLTHRVRADEAFREDLDGLIVEIVDEVFLPLVRAVAGPGPGTGTRARSAAVPARRRPGDGPDS